MCGGWYGKKRRREWRGREKIGYKLIAMAMATRFATQTWIITPIPPTPAVPGVAALEVTGFDCITFPGLLGPERVTVGSLPEEILLRIFRYLPVHIVYGNGAGEQGHPTGVIAVCARWLELVTRRGPKILYDEKIHFWKSEDFAKKNEASLWRLMGSSMNEVLPLEDEPDTFLQVTSCHHGYTSKSPE